MAAVEGGIAHKTWDIRCFAFHHDCPDAISSVMLDTFKSLPEDPTELRAVSKLMAAEIQSQAYQIEKLKGQLAGHQKARFGSKSETLDQLTFDLAEDTEIEAAVDAQKAEQCPDAKPTKRKHSRKPLPDHLDRMDEVLSAGDECTDCGAKAPPSPRR